MKASSSHQLLKGWKFTYRPIFGTRDKGALSDVLAHATMCQSLQLSNPEKISFKILPFLPDSHDKVEKHSHCTSKTLQGFGLDHSCFFTLRYSLGPTVHLKRRPPKKSSGVQRVQITHNEGRQFLPTKASKLIPAQCGGIHPIGGRCVRQFNNH